MSKVVNVKVIHLRPRYKNLREWIENTEENVYIGRKGVVFIDGKRFPDKASPWANPFKISDQCSRQQAIGKYEAYIRVQIEEDPVKYDLMALKDKRLGCWCSPDSCHGDVLLRLINEEKYK